MAYKCCKDFKTVLRFEIGPIVHDVWDSGIYVNT